MRRIHVGKDFSMDPSGRYYSDGSGASGEQFREEVLMPILRELVQGEKVVIVLDEGPESYGSSFLTEAFAGVVKYGYMEAQPLLGVLEFQFSDPDFEFFKDKIEAYIKDAKFGSKAYKPTK